MSKEFTFFDDKKYKKYGEGSLEYKVMETAEAAMVYSQQMDSVDGKFLIDTDRGRGRLEVIESSLTPGQFMSQIYTQVEDYGQVGQLEPPKFFDFITGIESMVAKGPIPDWTGCGKKMEIRGARQGNGVRHRYSVAVASRVRSLGYMIDPGQSEVYNFPTMPIYFTHTQRWHEAETVRLQDVKRMVIQEILPSEIAYLTIDTFPLNGRYPPRFLMLVPHPTQFLQNYQDATVSWDGEELTYNWRGRHYHTFRIRPRHFKYYSTAATDARLGEDRRAYWLFTAGVDLPSPTYIPTKTYLPSYHIGIDENMMDERKDGTTIVSQMGTGSTMVDLDQDEYTTIRLDQVCSIYQSDETGYPLIGAPQAAMFDTDVKSKIKLPVFIFDGQRSTDMYNLPGRFTTVSSVAGRACIHPIVQTDYPIAIFASYQVLERNFFSFYLKYRPTRSWGSDSYVPEGITQIMAALNEENSFIEYGAKMQEMYGPLSVLILIVLLRQNGAMLDRHDNDRYVTEPKLPGVFDSARVWNILNSHRQVRLTFATVFNRAYVEEWLCILSRNRFQAYFDDYYHQIIVMDPFSRSMATRVLQVENGPALGIERLSAGGKKDVIMTYRNRSFVSSVNEGDTVAVPMSELRAFLTEGFPNQRDFVFFDGPRMLGTGDQVCPRMTVHALRDLSPIQVVAHSNMTADYG